MKETNAFSSQILWIEMKKPIISSTDSWCLAPDAFFLDFFVLDCIIKVSYREKGVFPMVYRMKVAGLERDLPLFPVSNDLYIAGFVIFGDAELTVACARDLLKKIPCEYDYMISAEAKGIPLIHEMARQNGDKKYILARKAVKIYMDDPFSATVRSITTSKVQTLYLDGNDAALMKGKRILIVDDVISTGESLKAIEALVEKAGGEIVGRMAILAEGAAAQRSDLVFLEELPVFNPDGTIKK